MRTCLTLAMENGPPLPEGLGPDIRYPRSLVEVFLHEYTREGDVVFDPFAGYGTTLVVAEAMGRAGYGVEFTRKRVEYIRSQIQYPERLIHGDSRRLDAIALPPLDFSITSPPYTPKHHPENPFTDYTEIGDGYEQYLADLQGIYATLSRKMKPGARAVIEIANLKSDEGLTTLAWDVARAVSNVLVFEGEVVIAWEPTYGYGYDHSYCLVFRK
jgi:DNA modification methylase